YLNALLQQPNSLSARPKQVQKTKLLMPAGDVHLHSSSLFDSLFTERFFQQNQSVGAVSRHFSSSEGANYTHSHQTAQAL
ncbi:hypothetical protein, partial [Microbulbifer discodermiae]|uniref:hypothetical protein n=1 Tax=Microbulbifer sp. 2201CG32-9 TaxID=3232309 RepID=UPI00345C284A